jgi:hypothetical protein
VVDSNAVVADATLLNSNTFDDPASLMNSSTLMTSATQLTSATLMTSASLMASASLDNSPDSISTTSTLCVGRREHRKGQQSAHDCHHQFLHFNVLHSQENVSQLSNCRNGKKLIEYACR